MFEAFYKTRKGMPLYIEATTKVGYLSMKNRLEELRPQITEIRLGKNLKLENEKKVYELMEANKEVIKNLPLWTIPNGLFMSGNLYANWAIAKQMASYQIIIPYLNTNIFYFDSNVALLASNCLILLF